MADDERRDEQSAEDAEGQAPAETGDDQASEQSAGEEPAPEEAAGDEQPAPEDAAGDEQPAGEEPAPEEAAGDEQPAPEDAAGDEQPATEPTGESPAEAKREQPPGAELDPIAIEPERQLSAEERARLEAEEEERARREAEATAEAGEEPVTKRKLTTELSGDARVQATGKRKSAIARVVLRAGSGEFVVNSRPLDEYFPRHLHQSVARQPLVTSGYEGSVDVAVRVRGGGIAGQAGAVRHGVARALTEVDSDLRTELKRRGLLTRDARRKERRKAGLKKARKKPQFSKR